MGCRCGGGAEHEHAVDPDAATSKSLHQFIDFSQSTVMNARGDARLDDVLRAKYLPRSKSLESDADQQLLIKIQFSGTVKVKVVAMETQDEDGPDTAPSHVKVFVNAPDLDFAAAESRTSAQDFDLISPVDAVSQSGPIHYPTKIFKFSNVNHLTFFFDKNFGAPRTRISFLGVYGDFSQTRIGVVNTSYETKPNVADHKADAKWMNLSAL